MVFFVISGFLITSNTIKRWGSIDNVPYKTFYFIRFARIAPSLLALLLILSLLHILGIEWFVIQNTSLIQALFSALTFQVNWLEYQTNSHLPAAWDLLWSLSVEEMFYLFFPVICIFIKNRIIFIFVMLAFIALGPFARTVFSTNDNWLDHSYLSCMDGIAIGCLAALFATMATFNKDKILKWFLWSGIVMFSIVFFFRKLTYDIGLTKVGLKVTILEVSIAFILIAIAKNQIQLPKLRFISSSLRWFGKNSYEIYLTHMLIEIPLFATFYLVQNSFVLSSLWCLAIVILCGLVGQIVSKYYSEPMNKVLRYKYLVK
jgi:peptidoglycan/LPS O-acetylase OafA/YrhL